MTIWIDNRLSGLRKWSEAQEPKSKEGVEARANDKPTEESDEEPIAADPMPHRPWLVPGVGRL
jgi:hypothetical protein